MKKAIRVSVWETNSSSCHSVSVSRKSNKDYESIRHHIDLDGILHIEPEEFGWEQKKYRFPYNKIQYAFEMILMTELSYDERKKITKNSDLNIIYNTEGFINLKTLLISTIDECKDVVIDTDFTYYDNLGYIDHQSCEGYNSLQEFLNDYDVNLEEFIFDTGVVLKTDNDNY